MAASPHPSTLVASIPAPALHLRAGSVIEANGRATDLLGGEPETLLDRLDPHDVRALLAAATTVVGAPASGRAADDGTPSPSAPIELRSAGPPPRRFFDAHLGPHPDGGVVVVLVEATEARRVEATLGEVATGVYTTDADLRLTWIPDRVAHTLGLDPVGMVGADVYTLVHPDDVPAVQELVGRAVAAPGVKHAGAMRIVHPHQPGVWWPIVAWVTWLPDDEVLGGLVVRFSAGLAADMQPGDRPDDPGTVTLGDASPMGFLNLTLEGQPVQRSTRVREILRPVGVADDISDWLDRVQVSQRDEVQRLLDAARAGHLPEPLEVCFSGHGEQVWVRLDVLPYRDAAGTVVGMFVNFLDITAEREARDELAAAREELWELANRDALTGLFNRGPFTERLSLAVASAAGPGRAADAPTVGLLVCDLDDFKQVNDHHGHKVGDEVLTVTARRLEQAVRGGDMLCRFGGDEFLVLCEHLHDPDELRAVAERIVEAFDRPIAVDGLHLDVGMSVGGALHVADDGADADALVRRADRALYAAKAAGRRRAEVA